jgi:UDP-N-acetylglucosamine--N-acetylmuramyl-(pentapeptide) pyrophosphoryl-undecaprenol N-acetylglucosamine transferase
MRIYFAPCGIALGHAGRCIPVARRFNEKGHSVYFSSYGEAVPFIRREGFNVGEVQAIRVYEKDDGTFNFRRTLAGSPREILTFMAQVGAELNLIEHFKPDLVVADSRLSTILAARMRRIIPVLMLHQLRIMIPTKRPTISKYRLSVKRAVERTGLEVLGSLWKLSKAIVVPDFPPPYTIAKANVVPSNQYVSKVKLVGPIISRMPDTLPPREEMKRVLGFDDKPLILAAISGTKAEKQIISNRLQAIFADFPEKYNIVLTKGLADQQNSELRLNDGRVQVHNWLKDRHSYLKACDVLVTRGGHNTVSEAIYYGKPMVVIPTPAHSEHQGIAESLQHMGLGIPIQQNALSEGTLLRAVQSLTEESCYGKKTKDAQKFALKFDAIDSIYKTVCRALHAPY